MQLDYRYVLLGVTILLILWFLIPNSSPEYYFYQDQNVFDGDYRIIVNQKLQDKFVDVLLEYANKADNASTRTLYVYMATYHILVMNFHPKRLEKLESDLAGVVLVRDDISYPEFKRYPNLQKAIGNLVGKELTDTERVFTTNQIENRKMIDVYLSTVFDMIEIVRVD
jgi:hypothetical protein